MKNCPTCYLDRLKEQYKQDKLNAARLAAKLKANEQGETMAIVKEGCIYRFVAIGELTAGASVLEYISKHNDLTA